MSDISAVVFLGASRFAQIREFSNPSFRNSKLDFEEYLRAPLPCGLGLRADSILDLFDLELSPGQQLRRVGTFLDGLKAAHPDAIRNVIIYYIGHGYQSGAGGREYFLALAETDRDVFDTTGLRVSSLGDVMKQRARSFRFFYILDCCFAGESLRSLMGDAEAAARLLTAPLKVDGVQFTVQVPRRGAAVLCAASPDEAARAPEGERRTVFSDALVEVLTRGAKDLRYAMTLADVRDLAWEYIREKHRNVPTNQVRPYLGSPDQTEGDIATKVLLFPNPGAGETQQRELPVVPPPRPRTRPRLRPTPQARRPLPRREDWVAAGAQLAAGARRGWAWVAQLGAGARRGWAWVAQRPTVLHTALALLPPLVVAGLWLVLMRPARAPLATQQTPLGAPQISPAAAGAGAAVSALPGGQSSQGSPASADGSSLPVSASGQSEGSAQVPRSRHRARAQARDASVFPGPGAGPIFPDRHEVVGPCVLGFCVRSLVVRVGNLRYPALDASTNVAVFSAGEPIGRPYRVIGVISHSDPGKYHIRSLEDEIPALESRAREIGANGIIIDSTRRIKSGLISTGIDIQARAIRLAP